MFLLAIPAWWAPELEVRGQGLWGQIKWVELAPPGDFYVFWREVWLGFGGVRLGARWGWGAFGGDVLLDQWAYAGNRAGLWLARTESQAGLWALDWRYWEGEHLYWRTRVKRARLSIRTRHLDLTLGRASYTYSTTYFFSPLAFLTPPQATSPDPQELPTDDGADLALKLGPWRIRATLAPDTSDPLARWGLGLWFYGLRGWLGGCLLGERADTILGLFGAQDFLEGTFRWEAAYYRAKEPRYSFNYDRYWLGCYWLLEYYRNGQSFPWPEALAELRDPFTFNERNYMALQAEREPWEDVRVGVWAVWCLDDRSLAVSPYLEMSPAPELLLRVGGVVFAGEEGEQFGGQRPFAFVALSWMLL